MSTEAPDSKRELTTATNEEARLRKNEGARERYATCDRDAASALRKRKYAESKEPCECGALVAKSNKKRHLWSARHQDFIYIREWNAGRIPTNHLSEGGKRRHARLMEEALRNGGIDFLCGA